MAQGDVAPIRRCFEAEPKKNEGKGVVLNSLGKSPLAFSAIRRNGKIAATNSRFGPGPTPNIRISAAELKQPAPAGGALMDILQSGVQKAVGDI